MKNIFILILLSILAIKNYGQTYYSFPTTRGIWTHEGLDEWWNPTGHLTIEYLSGDTVIGSFSYKKIFEDTPSWGGHSFKGGLRESNRKIYYYSIDSLNEFLLYDFNKQLGDTVFHPYGVYNGIQDTLIVQQIDSILCADGNYHKIWYFTGTGCASPWIEGVGSQINLLAPPYFCSVSGGIRLNCFINDSNLVYSYPGTACITSIEDLETDIRSLKIFPNPTTDLIKVEKYFSVEKNSGYKIRNIAGQIIQENIIIPTEINIKEFANGTYFISFENNGKIATRKFIKN